MAKQTTGCAPRRIWRAILATLVAIGLFLELGAPLAIAASALPDLNSPYTDEQPALSGSGRYVVFVSARNGRRSILLYDLQQQRLAELPWLNRRDAIAEAPSVSNNARYIVYVASDSGRPEIELYDRITRTTQVLSTSFRGWFRNPRISPDGRYVAFEAGNNGQWDIQVIDRGAKVELDLLEARGQGA